MFFPYMRGYPQRPALGAVLALGLTAAASGSPQSPFSSNTVVPDAGDRLERTIIATGPVNDDGLDDVMMYANGGLDVGYKLNLGGGQFGPAVAIVSGMPNGNYAPTSAAGDLNGDGLLDLAFVNPLAEQEVFFALNLGDGNFATPTLLATVAPSTTDVLRGLEVRDVDSDGHLDIVAYLGFGPIPFVAVGAGDGTTTDLVKLTGSLPAFGRLNFADVDGDGQNDLIMEDGLRVAWAKGLGSGTFGPRVTILFFSSPSQVGRSVLLDVDQDGIVDILFDQIPPNAPTSPRTLHWIRSEGGGSFAAPASLGTQSLGINSGSAVDFDLDGDLDLFIVTYDTGLRLAYHENLGPGQFGPVVALAVSGGFAGNPATTLDVDGDGDLEVMVATSAPISALGFQLEYFDNAALGLVGTSFCGSFVPNSTGAIGGLSAYGSTQLSLNRLGLTASNLPTYAFGFFIASQTQGFTFGTPGVVGPLCLGGEIGRFVRPGEIQQSNASGTFTLNVDLTDMPQPAGGVAVQAGETWNFQAWHRDLLASSPVSNFTVPVTVTF